MVNFYNLSARQVAGISLFRFDFFATAPDMRSITPVDYDLDGGFAIIPFVGAEMMRLIWCRFRPFNDNGLQTNFQLRDIMPICPGYDEREWDATRGELGEGRKDPQGRVIPQKPRWMIG